MASSKRQHQGIDNEKGECVIVAEVTSKTARLPLKLIDLNEDVLEKIFSYLSIDDLVNIVKLDKAFLSSTRRAFKIKFKNQFIDLPVPFKKTNVNTKTGTKMNMKRNAELLHNFGESISKMKISMDEISPTTIRIYRLIVTTCHETLTEMELCGLSGELNIDKCFTKLHTLKIHGSVGQSINQFHKWFPMLENLFLDCVTNTPLRTRSDIKSLKCLSVDFSDDELYRQFYKVVHIEDINRFIQCNSQLRELRLTLDDDMICSNMRRYHRSRGDIVPDIFPEKQMTVKLQFTDWTDDSKALTGLKIPNDHIEHLEVTAEYLTLEVRDYVAKCVNLKTLKVSMNVRCYQVNEDPGPHDEEVWIHSAKHDLLTQLEISINFLLSSDVNEDCSKMILSAIRPYIKHCKRLDTIQVRTCASRKKVFERLSDFVFDTIRAQKDIKMWTFTYKVLNDEHSFTLKKL